MAARRLLAAAAAAAGAAAAAAAPAVVPEVNFLAKSRPPRDDPSHSALVVIDMQNDFMDDFPGAALPVANASTIIPLINDLIGYSRSGDETGEKKLFSQLVFTTDFHPPNHMSFAEESPFDMEAYGSIDVQYDSDFRICGKEYVELYGTAAAECAANDVTYNFSQTLWPKHCVQGTAGQHIDSRVDTTSGTVVRKGVTTVIDSYGAFTNNVGNHAHGSTLHKQLAENTMRDMLHHWSVDRIYIVGVALDYCVYHTALQAVSLGFETFVVEDATKAVSADTAAPAIEKMKVEGVKIIHSSDIPGFQSR